MARRYASAQDEGGGRERAKRSKQGLLVLAGVRLALGLVALPLVPVLYRHYFLALLALRPSFGVLLAGAILARGGAVSLPAMLAVFIPLQLLFVWLYFLLGHEWESEINSDNKLPFLTARLLQPRQIRRLRRVLRRRGIRLVVMARFAIFPTGLLAATAGASDMKPKRFFIADGIALLVASGLVAGAGYGLGLAQRQSDTWLLAAGIAGLLALSGLLTWYLSRSPAS